MIFNPYWYFQSVLTPDECNKIIDLGLNKDMKEAVTHGNNEKSDDKTIPQADTTVEELQKKEGKNLEEINPYIRDSKVSWLNDQWIYDRVWPYLNLANRDAGWKYNFAHAESFQFTTYKDGGFYGWHQDSGTDHHATYRRFIPGISRTKQNGQLEKGYTTADKFIGKVRKLSVTINLNKPGEYEGGNLKFDYGPHTPGERYHECIEIRPQGSIIVFPSFMYHQVTPVTKGTRYSLVLWALGEPFK